MISISDLHVSYGKQKEVIKNLHLSLPESKIHGIVGLNGAGKTTLLNTIYGLQKPDSGTIKWGDHAINKKQVAYLEAENYFYPNITGREYLDLFQNPEFNPDEWNQLFNLPL